MLVLVCRFRLRLDGAPIQAAGASLRAVFFRVADVAPGRHAVSLDGGDRLEFTVIRVNASLDTSELWRAESTQLRIGVEGADEPLSFRIANQTPAIVTLEPVAYQVAETSGGSPNRLERRVRGVRRGQFQIDYQLAGSECPCGRQRTAEQVMALVTPAAAVAQLAAANALAVAETAPLASAGGTLVVFDILDGAPAAQKAAVLAAGPGVLAAQPNFRYRTLAQGSDLAGVQYGPAMIKADQVTPGVPVRLALIDTGVESAHPSLQGAIEETADFTGRGFSADIHGTLLAGIVGARARIRGLAPNARLLAYKACQPHSAEDVEAACTSASLAKGMDRAIQKEARVINLSVGGPQDRLLGRLVTEAVRRGAVVVAAAGNGGPEANAPYPAAQPEVLAVTAVDDRERLYPRATRGGFVDLAAPGVDILSTAPGGRFVASSGTSLAAAHVSGAIALLLSQKPEAAVKELREAVEGTAHELSSGAPAGRGLVDSCRAARLLARGAACR